MAQSLGNGQVGIVELDIFAHQTDGDGFASVVDPADQRIPFIQIRFRGLQPQLPADNAGEMLLFQHQRRFIQHRKCDIFNNTIRLDVAEHADFLENAFLQRLITAQNDDIRLDTHALQFPDGVLGGFALVLLRAAQIGNQGHMDKQAVFLPHLQGDLAHRLQKGLGFDVTDGAADLRNDNIRIRLLPHTIDKGLDLVGHMGDDLHRGAEIFSLPLLVQNVPIDLSCGQVGVFV